MKRFAVSIFIAAALVIYSASGSVLLQPEHQAYVLFLGLEQTDAGQVRLSALCPKIAGDKQAEYQMFEAEAANVVQAFQTLERTVPRHMVYVQLKALLMTPEFAASEQMSGLIYYLLLGAEYYSDAWVMICPDAPSGFLKDYKPAIGTRLSASIQATMANAAALNMVPTVHLADLLDGWHGIYGDVPAIACSIKKFGDTPSVHPEGTMLFADQDLSIQLNAEETALMNWLRGEVREIQITDGDNVISISPELPPKVEFDRKNGRIRISGHFVQHQQADSIRRSQVQYLLEDRIMKLVQKCQAANSEPFRFSEYAAAGSLDLQAFLASDFRTFYKNASVTMNARVRNELT